MREKKTLYLIDFNRIFKKKKQEINFYLIKFLSFKNKHFKIFTFFIKYKAVKKIYT